jgi:Tfp pilus assembly protein PilP
MYIRPLIGIFVATIFPFAYAGQDAPLSIEISVRDIYASGLAVNAANALKTSIVVGGYARQRINWTEKFSSKESFMLKLTKKLNGRLTKYADINIISNKCITKKEEGKFNPFGERKISFNFKSVDAIKILNLLHVENTRDTSNLEYFKGANFGLVGMSLKDEKISTVYNSLVIATGINIFENSFHQLEIQRNDNCKYDLKESLDVPFPNFLDNNCDKNRGNIDDEVRPKCAPLEYYKLENITLRGYMKMGNEFFVFAETPDHLTWLIQHRDYMGYNVGIVTNISNKGIKVSEINQNPYGFFYDQKIVIDFRNVRKILLEK